MIFNNRRQSNGISRETRRALLLPLFICLLAMFPLFKSALVWADIKISDLLFAYSPVLRYFTDKPELPQHPVVIVNKDQTFFDRFHRDPDRSDFAALTKILHSHGTEVMAYDFVFNEAGDPQKDAELAHALAVFPLPVLAKHYIGRGTQTFEKIDLTDDNASRPPWPAPPYARLSEKAAATALINLAADFDSTVRFAPLAFHPAEMEDFLPSLGYATYIAALIANETTAIHKACLGITTAASAEEALTQIAASGKYDFQSTGHQGIDAMTRRLELLYLARICSEKFKLDLTSAAGKISVAKIANHKTWLQMPAKPLPIIGSYHLPCLRLPFAKLSPPFKGDGITVFSMGTLLETAADKSSTLLQSKQLLEVNATAESLSLPILPPTACSGTATIAGKIMNQQLLPMANVEVLLLMTELKYWRQCNSAKDGSFVLENLPAGNFTLQVTSRQSNGWQKASMTGKVENDINFITIPDLYFPDNLSALQLKIPTNSAPVSSIAIFGEPLAIIKSDNAGKTGSMALPPNHSIAALAEDMELTFENGNLLLADQTPAPLQMAAILADDSPWTLRFYHQLQPNPGQHELTVTNLPASLDARLVVFATQTGAATQNSKDITILPDTQNDAGELPTWTLQSNKTVTTIFTTPNPDDAIKLELLSTTGEKFTGITNRKIELPTGQYLVLTTQQDNHGIFTPNLINSKTVFFGSALPQDQDFVVTPINFMDQAFNRLPGVNLHANLFSALMRQSYLKATPAHADINPYYWPILQTIILLPFLILINLVFINNGAKWGGICVILTTVAWLLTGTWLFLNQWLLPFFFPGLQLLSFGAARGYISWAVARQQEKETRHTFGRFISPAIVDDILRTPNTLKPGGEKKELSIIFTDLAGFTSISEKLEPEQLTELMNEYLDEMTKILFQFGGTLDKYIGDAIMGFWNHPKAQPDHAQRSVDCAIQMQKRLAVLRDNWVKKGLPKVEVRAGINSAVCMVGFIGSEIQMNFTCLGDGVNLASRLEGANKAYNTFIMIAESVHRQINLGAVSTRFLDFLAVKGKEKPMEVFEVRGYRADEPEAWLAAETLYKSGIKQYLSRQWDEAISSFAAVIKLLPGDGPSQIYIERCSEFKAAPPPENWDGRFILKSK